MFPYIHVYKKIINCFEYFEVLFVRLTFSYFIGNYYFISH